MIKKLVVLVGLAALQLQAGCHNPCDFGPNNNLPAPVLTSAVNNNGSITVKGKFRSRGHGNSGVIIQFFGNPTDRGVTEGQDYLGQIFLETSCTGRGSFNVTLPPTQIDDAYLSATATVVEKDTCNRHHPGKLGDTSEFSKNIPIS